VLCSVSCRVAGDGALVPTESTASVLPLAMRVGASTLFELVASASSSSTACSFRCMYRVLPNGLTLPLIKPLANFRRFQISILPLPIRPHVARRWFCPILEVVAIRILSFEGSSSGDWAMNSDGDISASV
jgi:hypothetical protein